MFRSLYFAARHFVSRYFRPDPSTGGEIPGVFIPTHARPRPRIAATVELQGVEVRLSTGTLRASAGVSAPLTGVSVNLETGRLDAEGIQNPTPEELATLLGLEAVWGE